jgi:hypothetical protein
MSSAPVAQIAAPTALDVLRRIAFSLGLGLALVVPSAVMRKGIEELWPASLLVVFIFAAILAIGAIVRSPKATVFDRYFPSAGIGEDLFRGILVCFVLGLGSLLRILLPWVADVWIAPIEFGFALGLVSAGDEVGPDQRKRATRPSYWNRIVLLYALAFGVVGFWRAHPGFARWISAGIGVLLGYSGLFVGLGIGAGTRRYMKLLQHVFAGIEKLAGPLSAFGFGFATIVVAFGCIYGAIARLQGVGAFVGIDAGSGLGTFLYFSLVTATTVGYGDIAPVSSAARAFAVLEILLSVSWTLVVFSILFRTYAVPTDDQSTK